MQKPGILDDLHALQQAELAAVAARGSSIWTGPLAVVLWVLPSALLDAEMGAMIARTGIEGQLAVKLTWRAPADTQETEALPTG
jgi:hypothetical protein